MAPGNVEVDNTRGRIITGFDDSNLLVQISGKYPVRLSAEQGWYSPEYGEREARTSVSALYRGKTPFVYISLLVPYKGTLAPDCRLITDPGSVLAGMKEVTVEVEIDGKSHRLTRGVETEK